MSCDDSEPVALFSYLVEQLNGFNLAYMHFIEPRVRGNEDKAPEDVIDSIDQFLKACKTVKITAGGYIDRDGGNHAHGANDIKSGHTDMVR
jgi:N-ethylmaleimide reductase